MLLNPHAWWGDEDAPATPPRSIVTLIGHAAPILTGTTQLPIERAWGFRSRGSLYL